MYELYLYIPEQNQIIGINQHTDEDLGTIEYSQYDAASFLDSAENCEEAETLDGGYFTFEDVNISEEIIRCDGYWPDRILIEFLMWVYETNDREDVTYFVMKGNDR